MTNSIIRDKSPMLVTVFIILILILGTSFTKASSIRANLSIEQYPMSNFSSKIAFIGDSITGGNYFAELSPGKKVKKPSATITFEESLGAKYESLNFGVNASTTQTWIDTYLDPAIKKIREEKADIALIMLGTNDCSSKKKIDPAAYKKNLETIISRLQNEAGIKKIVLNEPPYKNRYSKTIAKDDERLREFINVLDEMSNGVDILRGSRTTYHYFEEHIDAMIDGVHPTEAGLKALGKQWAEAFKQYFTGF